VAGRRTWPCLCLQLASLRALAASGEVSAEEGEEDDVGKTSQ